MNRTIKIAAIFMMLFVILGAFGAHGLKEKLDAASLKIYHTAVFYHAIHGLALFVVAFIQRNIPSRKVDWAGRFFIAGIFLFSGSLYLLSITGFKKIGIITPIGGFCFIFGWLLLMLQNYKMKE